jgi:hypothetical protein
MQYQTPEERQIFNNQSQNRFSENQNIPNFNLAPKNNQKIQWIYVNPSIYIMYCLLNGISLSAGCFLKLLFPISRETIGKKSIITGIPIIRNYYFVFPFLLNLIYFIWCIYKYYTDSSIRNGFENSLFKFLKEIRGAFFFTNILLLLIFYALYYCVVLTTYKSYGFKLSGHVIASILSGGMIVNLHNTYEPFILLRKDPNFNKYISYANTFLYYHSIYTIFWSAWIFHQVLELILAYTISVASLVLAHVINIDELLLNLIDMNDPRKNPIILYRCNNK